MFVYSIGILPLIRKLKDPTLYRQNWYADDSSCAGRLQRIREWFLKLLEVGPSYGYFAEPSKSLLVVKEDQLNEAKNVFSDLNVEITLGGRFLGGVIGDSTEAQQYVADKVAR